MIFYFVLTGAWKNLIPFCIHLSWLHSWKMQNTQSQYYKHCLQIQVPRDIHGSIYFFKPPGHFLGGFSLLTACEIHTFKMG